MTSPASTASKLDTIQGNVPTKKQVQLSSVLFLQLYVSVSFDECIEAFTTVF